MDFNSNEEFLKAFPPNFDPQIAPPKKIWVLDLGDSIPQENIAATAWEFQEEGRHEAQFMETEEPMRAEREPAGNARNETEQGQHEPLPPNEAIATAEARPWVLSSPELAVSKKPIPQTVQMALPVQAQTDDEMVKMVLDVGDAMRPVETTMEEPSALQDEPAGVEAERLHPAEGTTEFAKDAKPANAMEAIERSFILGETPDQVLSEKVPATKMLQEPTRHTGAAGQIKVQVPVTDEETEKPTIRALPQTKICQEESPFTPFTSEMSEDPTEVEVKAILAAGDRKLAFEVIPSKPREFNIKAKGIHRKQDEVPRSTMEVDQSTSVSMAGFYEESSAYVDNIVDRIINDIAGIEADLEVEI
ncbi:uncharacterized protein [Physcomitrium patens]|uniref:uncharacterized protein isoform X1 n=1 Tax=Physcomitrium patens TaxID=3218 RepID=UPI000D173C57|nr:uncharacterized protein LOC112288914 isoform X1 [Physcomitrium patens]|eukprot:XP_024389418.1 uncharacterized protein LOC112288914 isoform X1 [Physcomitrella patens]